ncbi:hypothetical protein OPT61_g6081 [Boeremia exigua]|uniref:Uncharacterized protein n=1 Tax=Boeremia exigua TaxID=749465 RepID=A0ACC2I7X2_9PLEO|nr:hypothetical protein OPT61_g6081 [Boeremia exigua]
MRIILGLTFTLLWNLKIGSATELEPQAVGMGGSVVSMNGNGRSHRVGVDSDTVLSLEDSREDVTLDGVINEKEYKCQNEGESLAKGELEKRANPKKNPAPPSKAPAPKPPAPKPTAPKPPVAKPTPTKPGQTPIKPKPIKTCKQLAVADTRGMLLERMCGGIKFDAYNYPSRGAYIKKHPDKKYYGFADPYSCNDYVWRADSSVEPPSLPGARSPGAGQTEHVLEWQSVTGFINWMSATRHSGRMFPHPDPTQGGQLSFCDYITYYWDLNSGNHRFALPGSPDLLTPTEHIASAYPRNGVHETDFVLLQDKINSPAKAHDESVPEIHGADTGNTGMTTLLDSEPRTVIQRLRYVLGARKYQSDRDIATIFVRMKNRMRDKLAQLDQALPSNPRPGFTAWDPAIGSLATAWDTYMDGAFLRAKAKQQRFMDKWIVRIVASDSAAVVQEKAENRALCDSYNILLDPAARFSVTMAIFNDLAIELQEAIWELVLPVSRGVHWIEVEGIPHDPEFIRDSIRMTQYWPVRRSMGPFYRPRPMGTWEIQYSGDSSPPGIARKHKCWQLLPARIHTLDFVVFRLHDSQGQATSLLRQAPWQYWIEQATHSTIFACFDRIGLEWHPSWGTRRGRRELRSENIQAFVREMQVADCPAALYWLVDGVPRPTWSDSSTNRDRPASCDYPVVVRDIWAERMAEDKGNVMEHLHTHWKLKPGDDAALLGDHHLGQEFEANGRRYYIVFVVFSQFLDNEREQLDNAGLGWNGPFPGSPAMWPEALRAPVRLAHQVFGDGSKNLGTYQSSSYILSWEPIR